MSLEDNWGDSGNPGYYSGYPSDYGYDQQALYHVESRSPPAKRKRNARCKYFNAKSGCSKGSSCTFLHERKPSHTRSTKKKSKYESSILPPRAVQLVAQEESNHPSNYYSRSSEDRRTPPYSEGRRTPPYNEGYQTTSSTYQDGAEKFLSSLEFVGKPSTSNASTKHTTTNTTTNTYESQPAQVQLLERKVKPEPTNSHDTNARSYSEYEITQTINERVMREKAEQRNAILEKEKQETEERFAQQKKKWEARIADLEHQNKTLKSDNELLTEKFKVAMDEVRKSKEGKEEIEAIKKDFESKLVERDKREQALSTLHKQASDKLKEATEAMEKLKKEKADLIEKNKKMSSILRAWKVERNKWKEREKEKETEKEKEKLGQEEKNITPTGIDEAFKSEVRGRLEALEKKMSEWEKEKEKEEKEKGKEEESKDKEEEEEDECSFVEWL